MDVELTEKLMAELSGIFNWALEEYKCLGGQKFIFSEGPSMCKSKKNRNKATAFWNLLIAVLKVPTRKNYLT
jgi:hypothetical protein